MADVLHMYMAESIECELGRLSRFFLRAANFTYHLGFSDKFAFSNSTEASSSRPASRPSLKTRNVRVVTILHFAQTCNDDKFEDFLIP